MGCVRIKQLKVKYSDDFIALYDINVDLPDKSFIALCGLEGSGKSSLAYAICGLKDYEGSITYDDKPLRPLQTGERGIGYLPEGLNLFTNKTVKENLEYGYKIRKTKYSEYEQRMRSIVSICGIKDILGEKVKRLDIDSRRRVALARLFMRENILYIIDCEMPELKETVLSLSKTMGATVLYLSSRYDDICKDADDIIFFRNGRKIDAEDLYVKKLCDPFLNVVKANVRGGICHTPIAEFESDIAEGEYYMAISPEDICEGECDVTVVASDDSESLYAIKAPNVPYYLYSALLIKRMGFSRARLFNTEGKFVCPIEMRG